MGNISSRKEKILQAVVEDYINSANPISSSEVQTKHLPSLSSATIRNELAALEEMGYLFQPHASAGRIPTSDGYRFYIEHLMPKRKLSRKDISIIKSHFNKQMIEMKDVIKKTAKVISEVTNYTSIAFVNDISTAVVENIKIVKLTPQNALVIVVTNLGVLKDSVVQLDGEYPDEYFDAVARFAVTLFKEKTIQEIMHPKKIIKIAIKEYRVFFDSIIGILKRYSNQISVDDLVLEGTSKILEYPEYSNITKAKAMLAILDAKEQLLPVLSHHDNMQLNISIGRDNNEDKSEPLSDCAIVTANYTVNGKSIGKAGVIGPIRMDYPKVISVLDYISKTIQLSSINNSLSLGERTSESEYNDEDEDDEDEDNNQADAVETAFVFTKAKQPSEAESKRKDNNKKKFKSNTDNELEL